MEFTTWGGGIHTHVNIPVLKMRKGKSIAQEENHPEFAVLPPLFWLFISVAFGDNFLSTGDKPMHRSVLVAS